MVNPLALMGAMPKVEGFAPLPSATAEAFMVLQGGDMALNFGAYYKLATRLMDSQSNDNFNKMVADPTPVTKLLNPHRKELFAQFQKTVAETSPGIQQLVMERAYDLEIRKIELNFKLLTKIPKEYFTMLGQFLRGEEIDGSDVDVDLDNTPDKFQPPNEATQAQKEQKQTKKHADSYYEERGYTKNYYGPIYTDSSGKTFQKYSWQRVKDKFGNVIPVKKIDKANDATAQKLRTIYLAYHKEMKELENLADSGKPISKRKLWKQLALTKRKQRDEAYQKYLDYIGINNIY